MSKPAGPCLDVGIRLITVYISGSIVKANVPLQAMSLLALVTRSRLLHKRGIRGALVRKNRKAIGLTPYRWDINFLAKRTRNRGLSHC